MAKPKRLSLGEISAFCAGLAMIIKSGVSVESGLDFMVKDASNDYERQILSGLLNDVGAGRTLSYALEKSGYFPEYLVAMTAVGEASGRMDEVLESLGEYYENSRALSRSVRSAVIYPAVMIVMMLAVIFILIVKVLPIFEQVFLRLGADMSRFTRSLLRLGGSLGGYAAIFGSIAAALIAAGLILGATRRGKKFLSRLCGLIFKRLSAKSTALRFANAMSLTLSSGLETGAALELARKLEDSPRTQEKILEIKERISAGQDFSQALALSGIFSHTHSNMIAIGCKTGRADAMMKKVAARCQNEVDDRISALISIVEPTLVAILSIIVGVILLSVMFPLIGIMSAIG